MSSDIFNGNPIFKVSACVNGKNNKNNLKTLSVLSLMACTITLSKGFFEILLFCFQQKISSWHPE